MRDGWTFADVWEAHAERFGDTLAQAQGERRMTWAELDRRADGVAACLLSAGLPQQAKVAQYLYNCPEYLESVFACFKAALVPVNTNYRYVDDEIVYLWDNADIEAVVFHGTFTPNCARLRTRLPNIRTWLWVDDGTWDCASWAVDYAEAAGSATSRTMPPGGRSGDDLYLLYTGGTTGLPKGVMWRQDDVVMNLLGRGPRPWPSEAGREVLEEMTPKPGPLSVPAAPLMHGTGAFTAMSVLSMAGSVITLSSRSFDPVELLDVVDRCQVRSVSLVGDAFSRPILQALDAEPERWDVSSLRIITSSGVAWTAPVKRALRRHNEKLVLVDVLGASEAMAAAEAVSRSSEEDGRPFSPSALTRVINDDGGDVAPGSGERGRLALKGRTALGYYKDPDKSAATFVTIDGERYSVPGDWATVLADGTVHLLGRGSTCINTGGEKVYPEEVEEALRSHPSVADVAVIGLPDPRMGESVTAVVQREEGADVGETALILHVRGQLAAYKAPKRVFFAPVHRAPNGKLDHGRVRTEVVAALAREGG